jgi:hypothetical protein
MISEEEKYMREETFDQINDLVKNECFNTAIELSKQFYFVDKLIEIYDTMNEIGELPIDAGINMEDLGMYGKALEYFKVYGEDFKPRIEELEKNILKTSNEVASKAYDGEDYYNSAKEIYWLKENIPGIKNNINEEVSFNNFQIQDYLKNQGRN